MQEFNPQPPLMHKNTTSLERPFHPRITIDSAILNTLLLHIAGDTEMDLFTTDQPVFGYALDFNICPLNRLKKQDTNQVLSLGINCMSDPRLH